MPSPFPGMDPYFEDAGYREGFHNLFIGECVYQLSDRLPAGYIANPQERVELISYGDEASRQYVPDVPVERPGRTTSQPAPRQEAAVALAPQPVTIQSVDTLEVREAYIQVQRQPDLQVVAVVELLSPWNKFGEGIGDYRAKRGSLVSHGVHVVELDLLVRGERTRLARPLPPGDYYAMVFDADRKPDVRVWGWGVRQPLPREIPLPLRRPDPPVMLDLAAVVNSVYDRGRYERKLRYRLACPAPLAPEDAAWAQTVAAALS